jgi:hypothetical protein
MSDGNARILEEAVEIAELSGASMIPGKYRKALTELTKRSDVVRLMERCVNEGLTVKFTYPRDADAMHQWGVSGRDVWATGRDLAEAYVRYVHERQYRGEGIA